MVGVLNKVALILSTYEQPEHLDCCLTALKFQSFKEFELIIADDGSGGETRSVIDQHDGGFNMPIRHLWQEDIGFRKTRILNQAILATEADYLVFMDGDCVAHPDYISEHVNTAKPRHYLNGAMIRLSERLTKFVNAGVISSGEVFNSKWLTRNGGRWNRRYLKLSLGYRTRRWLNGHSPTTLHWLGANSSCFRQDALAVNGFDNRFSYGLEDRDFGNRLENYGLSPATVRWTANVLHLDHGRPWSNPEELDRNRRMLTASQPCGKYWVDDGLTQLMV